MSFEIIVALLGVLASVAVSVFTSLRATNTELQKLRTEVQQTYAGKLLDKRLETYPDLYCLLSNFAKKAWLSNVSNPDLKELLERANE